MPLIKLPQGNKEISRALGQLWLEVHKGSPWLAMNEPGRLRTPTFRLAEAPQ